MEPVLQGSVPEVVKVGASGKRFSLASVIALLIAASCPVSPAERSAADCEKKTAEDIYGAYVYDTLRLRPVWPLTLSVEETYGDYEQDEEPEYSWSGMSEIEARSLTGLQVSIEPTRFQRGMTLVVDPYYEIRCEENFSKRFPSHPSSIANVFGRDREFIDTLSVFQKGDAGRKLRIARFEIVGDDLWVVDRAWLFVLKRKD